MVPKKFHAYSAAILLLALLVREWFVIAAVFPNPTQGDVSSYLRYAMHLVEDGVFTSAEYGQPVVPDAYRGPGYPFFLAALLRVVGERSWMPAIQQAQVLLGMLTVFAVIALGKIAIGDRPALMAGAWMAFEPHNIAAAGTVMTEVLFGCLLTLALLCLVRTLRYGSWRTAIAAGVLFGYAYLVNPVVALFPVLTLWYFWRRGNLSSGLIIVAVVLAAMAGWEVRNRMVHAQSSERAAVNFVQGSWPDYHQAWKYHLVDRQHRETYDRIGTEIDLLKGDPPKGFGQVLGRLSVNPAHYAFWYLIQKPFLLWDWDIRLGAGGVNYLDTSNSPLERSLLLRSVVRAQEYGNPMLFVLALVGIIATWRQRTAFPLGLCFLYLTVIHDIFQADPRYSTSYKSVEILLAVYAIAYAYDEFSRYRAMSPHKSSSVH